MHRVFYIDPEEEVTSVIERLRKSTSVENIFVVPSRALILGSVVSLKLIKKKADELRKQVMIVTQDRQGQDLVTKSGMRVRESLDQVEGGLRHPNEIEQDVVSEGGAIHIDVIPEGIPPHSRPSSDPSRLRKNMNGIDPKRAFRHSQEFPEFSMPPESPTVFHGNHRREENVDRGGFDNKQRDVYPERKERFAEPDRRNYFPSNRELSSREVVISEKDFREDHDRITSKKMKIIFFSFLAVCILLVSAVLAYVFLPTAEIYVYPQKNSEKADFSVRADINASGIDVENNSVKAELVEVSDTISVTKDSTGEEFASSQKATGKITIYNEYGKDSQSLVVSTRFETSDGKIFRLKSGVVVPGYTEENGTIAPGSVEADIVADQAGEKYNIDPSKFTIPGFKDGPKYDKFYAKSTKKMSGGGAQGDLVKVISKDDMKNASADAEAQIKEKLLSKLKENVKGGYFLDENSVRFDTILSNAFPKEGTAVKTFEYQLEMKASALTFSEADVKDLVTRVMWKGLGDRANSLDMTDLKIEYGQMSADFIDGVLDISLHADAEFVYKIDEEKIFEQFAGVSSKDLKSVIDQQSEIRKMDVVFWPKMLVSSIPKKRDRVEIFIKED